MNGSFKGSKIRVSEMNRDSIDLLAAGNLPCSCPLRQQSSLHGESSFQRPYSSNVQLWLPLMKHIASEWLEHAYFIISIMQVTWAALHCAGDVTSGWHSTFTYLTASASPHLESEIVDSVGLINLTITNSIERCTFEEFWGCVADYLCTASVGQP